MQLITLFSIAIALAMDAFAVSVASGIAIKKQKLRHALRIALWFGLFQALMPLAGWAGGVRLRESIGDVDHWVAFGLLFGIGCKMIYESFKIPEVEEKADRLSTKVLFVLSIATSIDALAAGISFAMLDVAIVSPILVIGVVTFLMSFMGVLIGDKAGHFFENRIEIAAGILLIVIGFKILLDHSAAV